jgi:hypothetical protein
MASCTAARLVPAAIGTAKENPCCIISTVSVAVLLSATHPETLLINTPLEHVKLTLPEYTVPSSEQFDELILEPLSNFADNVTVIAEPIDTVRDCPTVHGAKHPDASDVRAPSEQDMLKVPSQSAPSLLHVVVVELLLFRRIPRVSAKARLPIATLTSSSGKQLLRQDVVSMLAAPKVHCAEKRPVTFSSKDSQSASPLHPWLTGAATPKCVPGMEAAVSTPPIETVVAVSKHLFAEHAVTSPNNVPAVQVTLKSPS